MTHDKICKRGQCIYEVEGVVGATHGGCMLLYFVKSKNGTKCKNFAVLLCFYVNTFILFYFLRFQERGLQPP